METEKTTLNTKKEYQSPKLKDLGKIGEVTNSSNSSGLNSDGGSGPNYYS